VKNRARIFGKTALVATTANDTTPFAAHLLMQTCEIAQRTSVCAACANVAALSLNKKRIEQFLSQCCLLRIVRVWLLIILLPPRRSSNTRRLFVCLFVCYQLHVKSY